MADVDAILAAFRLELILAGLVRRPSQPAPDAPPMFNEPIGGPPAPGELADRDGIVADDGLVLSLMHSGDLGEASGYDAAAQRRTILDVRYRSATPPDLRRAMVLDAAIRERLIRPETHYGYGFSLGGDVDAGDPGALWALEVGVFGGLGPIGRSPGQGYDHVAKWLVATAGT